MRVKVRTVGYHGTTRENAEKILAEKHFVESQKENEWLGKGVYFFAYQAHADWWIRARRYRGKETRIVVADLEYTDEQLLDLDDPEQMQFMEQIVKEFARLDEGKQLNSANLSIEKRSKQLCWACNLIKAVAPEIGIIIYTFPRERVYEYTFFQANQRQICVSDHSIIKAIRKVAGDNDAG